MEIVALVMAAGVAIAWIDRKGKERKEQLRVIEEELKNPSLSAAQRDALHDELLGEEARKERQRQTQRAQGQGTGSAAAKTSFAFGWLGLFVAGGLGIAGDMSFDGDLVTAAFIVGLSSLALITLPIAIREFDRAGERKSTSRNRNAGERA